MDLSKENLIILIIILFMWTESLWEIYLSWRQIKVYKTSKKIPSELRDVIDNETFQKARVYGLDKAVFGDLKSCITLFINTAFVGLGWMAFLWKISEEKVHQIGLSSENEITVSCCFLLLVNIVTTIMDIPFSVYFNFVLEAKHGFNKQTPGFFIKDTIKGFVVSQVFSLPLAAAIIYIIQRGGDMFIVWLWLFSGVMTLVFITIYPSLIAPLFDKYSPLPEGPLRSSIEKLADSLKFPLGQLYVVEGSKRSAHSNAYFYGLFGTKRIVLFDTLLESYTPKDEKIEEVGVETKKEENKKKKGCSDAEVLAVLAHELGHWSYGHVRTNLIMMQVNLLLMFGAFGFLFKYAPLYTALGFPAGQQPILVGLVVVLTLILAPYNAILSFGMTALSRKFEFQADNFAVKLGFAKDLQKSLIKLNIDNLGFPIYDSWYTTWHHSHPTLLQRIENMQKKSQ